MNIILNVDLFINGLTSFGYRELADNGLKELNHNLFSDLNKLTRL